MAINPLIALSGEKLDTATPIMNYQKMKSEKANQELVALQTANAKIEGMSAREKARIESVVNGAAELDAYLESGDIKGAETWAIGRKKRLGEQIAAGMDVDTTETDGVLNVLRGGDPEALKTLSSQTKQLIKLGQHNGMLKVPASEGFNLSPGQTRYDAAGNAVVTNPKSPDGSVAVTNPETGEVTYVGGKALPISASKGILENRDNIRKAATALSLINGENITNDQGEVVMTGNKEATGIKGNFPEEILQYTDPEGVDTRAAIADLGSMIIHDRSGAAVSASEYPRLKPFIPKANDKPDVVKQKLSRFLAEFEAINEESEGFYRESGYNVPAMKQAGSKKPAAGSGQDDPLGLR